MSEKRSRKPIRGGNSSPPNASPSSLTSPSATAPPSSSAPALIAVANEDDLPPSYTGPSQSSISIPTTASPQTSPTVPGMPPVDFSLYRIPGAVVSKDLMTCTTNIAQYSWSASALLDLLQTQSKLPPHPQIWIRGTREGFGNEFDFDIRISMLRYITREPDSRGGSGWNYVKLIEPSEMGWRGGKQESRAPHLRGGLKEWISRFVAEESKDKRYSFPPNFRFLIVSNSDASAKLHAPKASHELEHRLPRRPDPQPHRQHQLQRQTEHQLPRHPLEARHPSAIQQALVSSDRRSLPTVPGAPL